MFCIQLWGKKNPPFIQTLHFAFGIGAFIAPLLAKPFLSDLSIVYNTTSIVQGNIPVAPFAYEELHHNRTKKSHIFEYPGFKHIKDDFFNNINNEGVLENNFLHYKMEKGHSLDRQKEIFEKIEHLHVRQKRQTGDGEDYTGIWKWKRHHPKRDSAPLVPDPGTTTVKPGDFKTEKSQNLPSTNGPQITGVGADGSKLSTKNSDASKNMSNTNKDDVNKIINKDKEKSKNATNINSVSDIELHTAKVNKTAGENPVAANGSKVKTNVTEFIDVSSLSSNVSIVESEITTMGTVNPPTTEEEIHKPSAATDENRNPGSADGKPIAKHLDKNKAAIKESESKTDEQNKDLENEAVDTVEENVNSTVPSVPKTLPGTNSSQVNITQSTSGEGNISTSAAVKIQTIQSALNPKNASEVKNSGLKSTTLSSKKTSTTTPVKKTNASRTPPPTTTTPSTTKEKTTTPTTTTVRTTTTPTTKVKSTMPTTKTLRTTTTATTTTTMVKTTTPTTTTAVGTTTTTTTLRPVTKGKTSGSVTNKGDQKPDTNEVAEKVKTTSSSPVNNSSVVVSTPNVTLPDDLLSTTEVSHKPESAIDSLLNNAIHAVQNISKIQFAYLIIGLALFLISVIFLVLYCKDKRRLTTDRDLDELERFKTGVTCEKATLISLLGLFFFCYMGLEVTFGALVTTFAVDFNKWPKEQGAMAAAIFWGSLATGRGLSIFLARCCGPTIMLIFDLIFMVIGGLVLSIGVHFYDKLLWLGTLILGLGMSSAFPAGISWAEKYFHLTGKSTAVFVVGSAVGQMVIPVVTGYFYEHLGAIVLMYSSLILSLITLVIFILMQCVVIKKRANLTVQERNGFLPLEDDDDAEENLEMDDLVHFDKSQTRMRRDKRGGGSAEYHTLISDLEDD